MIHHDYDTIIQAHELKRWLKDFPSAKDYLSQGYRESIPDIKKNVFSDLRATTCDHILNPDFKTNPKYFFAFRKDPFQNLLAIACIYVFPEYRGRGYGSHMINQLKGMVRDQGVAQAAVEKEKVELLTGFYLKHGFKTTATLHTNPKGESFVDFFWSGKNYILHDGENGTVLEPRPYDSHDHSPQKIKCYLCSGESEIISDFSFCGPKGFAHPDCLDKIYN